MTEDRDIAWAERSYRKHPAFKHFIAKYVESDRANANGQLWTLSDLQNTYETVKGAPVNWSHMARKILGTVRDAELLYPKEADEAAQTQPFVEILGTIWSLHFPEEYKQIEAANAEGRLFTSMECVSQSLTCVGGGGCGATFAYKGPQDDSYCICLREHRGNRQLNSPTFLGAALLVPPVVPGWKDAKVDLSKLLKEHAEGIDRAYSGIAGQFPHLEPKDWENIMHLLLFSTVK